MADDQSSKRCNTNSGASGDSASDDESENYALRSEVAHLRQQLLSEVARLRQRLEYLEGYHDVLPVITHTPTVDLSRLDKGLVTYIVSFLGTSLDLRNLALTCRSFGWQQPGSTGQDLSLVEEIARQVLCSRRNNIKGARITLSPYVRGTTTWLSILRESEEPLKFDTLLGNGIEHTNEGKFSVHANAKGSGTAVASNYVMASGIHYAEFHFDAELAHIGIVRPMPNLDRARYANDFFYFLADHWRDHFLAARTDEWGRGNVHLCYYITFNGKMCLTNWDNEQEIGVDWEGMKGCKTVDTLGMLLNLEDGTLTVYKNNRRLGVMKDGLSGSYCWFAHMNGAVTIERCDPPLA